jgi:signal transduction histidine kinase/CheY-like chemotaxis protein
MKHPFSKKAFVVILVGILLIGVVYGVCTVQEKREGEGMITETLDFLKQQCTRYENQVTSEETQTQIALLDKAEELARQLQEQESAQAGDFLAEYATNQRLSGIILLDGDGMPVETAFPDGETFDNWKSTLLDADVADVREHPQKKYMSHLEKKDGTVYDYVAIAYGEEGGILFVYVRVDENVIEDRESRILNMLTGYQIEDNGIVMITKDSRVLTSNADSYPSVEVCESLQEKGTEEMLTFGDQKYLVGCATTGDYTLYALFPTSAIYQKRLVLVAYVLIFYVFFLLLYQYLQQREEQKAEGERLKFLRQMSHDIRTPINGIRGMIRIANSVPNDLEKQEECRRKIWEASDYLIDLVNDVLEMGKLDSGEVVIEERPFDLRELIASAVTVLEGTAERKDITITIGQMEGMHWKLIGSPVPVRRILNNIVSNAIKYNKKHGTVTLSCRETDSVNEEGQIFFEFVCEDSGIGMSREFQGRMYEQFTQENEVGEVEHHGTGLGLSIVKRLVDQLHGTISCVSRRGEGTTFTVSLPFAPDPAAEPEVDVAVATENPQTAAAMGAEKSQATAAMGAEKPQPAAASPESSGNPLDGLSVLLVEDNEMNMEIAEFILEELGMKTTEAWNGQEAVTIFEQSEPGQFDIILMDMMMPVMNGEEATRAIRALARKDAGTIPIIAATANAFAEDVQAARDAGMNDHLAKPIDIEPLRNMILKYV